MSNTIDISVLENIRKVGSDFSFSQTFLSNINNVFYIERLLNANSQANIVPTNNMINVLSAISDQLGTRIYEEILNYIDNVGNVDVCKIKALQTMAKMLGISYSAFSVINDMPLEIQNMMNIMSITPEYLLRSNKICNFLTSYIYNNATNSISNEQSVLNDLSDLRDAYSYDDNTSSNVSAVVDRYIDIDTLDNVISSMYATQIRSILLSSYYDFMADGTPILSTNIISCNTSGYRTYSTYINNEHQILLRSEADDEKISKLKKYYNLPFFNEIKAANDVELGIKYLDDYTTYEQEIIQVELNRRTKAYDISNPLSRYAYYRAQNVQKYIDFVENMFSVDKLDELQAYQLDTDYVLLKSSTTAQLLSADNDNGDNETIDQTMIDKAAQQLAVITQYIRELRHKIKSQAQKNCMKGTFIFLNYIVNEYLKENIFTNKQYISSDIDLQKINAEVQLIEYIDPTNYFNISTDVDAIPINYYDNQTSASLNERYWEKDGSVPTVVSPDNTNIFAGQNIIESKSTAFSEEAISAFYIDMLNNTLGDTAVSGSTTEKLNHLHNFLCAIFDSAADNTYKDISGNICCTIDMTKYNEMVQSITQQITQASLSNEEAIAVLESTLTNEINEKTIATNNVISSMHIALSNELFKIVESASADVQIYIDAYNNGTLSNYFTIDTSHLDESQLEALSTYMLRTLSVTRYTDVSARQYHIQNQSAMYEAEMLSQLDNDIQQLSSQLSSFKQTKNEELIKLSTELYKQLDNLFISNEDSFIQYKKELYYKYSGLSTEDLPFYNYPNKIHPSYQIHPYLSTFIESFDYSYIIENMPVLAEATMFELLSKNIDQYIDDKGYLLSVWNNPLNRNSDYLTHYEKVPHIDSNNKINRLYGYDGLFYPTAVNDLLNELSDNNGLNGKILRYIDKWYDSLNVSEAQRTRIYNQLSSFYNQIKIVAAGEKYYDIYRYARDIFGNMYILLKNYGLTSLNVEHMQNIPEEQKRNTPGSLWIRLKNHPIAFPAYMLNKLSSFQQIDYNIETSNTALFKSTFDYSDIDPILNGNIPPIYDFFMSQDKQQIEIFAKLSGVTNSTGTTTPFGVVIAGINQQYNYNNDIDRYELFLNSVRQKESDKFEKRCLEDNEYFVNFVNYQYNIGYVTMLSSGTPNHMNVDAQQIMFNDPNIENYVENKIIGRNLIVDFNNQLSDIKVDVCNDKMYFAYTSSYVDSSIDTYFSNSNNQILSTYHDLSSCEIDIFENKMIVMQQAEVGKYAIKPISKKYYLPFTNMGFLPAVQNSMLSTSIKETDMTDSAAKLMQKYGIVKIQPVSKEMTNVNTGIQFIYCLPYERLYEQTKNNNTTKLVEQSKFYKVFSEFSNLSIYSYNSLHSFESTFKDLSAEIYEPYTFKEFMAQQPESCDVYIKISEQPEIIRALKTNQLLMNQVPWLVYGNIPDNCITPGSTQGTAMVDNTATIRLYDDPTVRCDAISVAWFRYEVDNNSYIKLDFNTKYYNRQINSNFPNYFNYQNSFLNLDYPGAAGYLKVYNDNILNINDIEEFANSDNFDNIYYIKNISDNKPKFLISAMNYIEREISVALLATDEIENIVDEYTLEVLSTNINALALNEIRVDEEDQSISVGNFLNINNKKDDLNKQNQYTNQQSNQSNQNEEQQILHQS